MRNLFFFLGLVMFFVACQEEATYTPSGTQYEMVKSTGGPVPQKGDYVYFHGQYRNGDSVLFASRDMGDAQVLQIPVTPPVDRPVSPVEELLATMAVGDSATIMYRLDTVPQKPAGFENADIMYLDLVSVDIKSEAAYQEELAQQREEARVRREAAQARFAEVEEASTKIAADYAKGSLNGQLQSTATGLKYIIHEAGEGKQAAPGKMVNVQYYGMLTDGKMFDNSFQRGDSFQFGLGMGQVIPGWDEGIALLKEGAKATFFIPAQLGYGPQGSPPVIPPDSELIFYVELEKVN